MSRMPAAHSPFPHTSVAELHPQPHSPPQQGDQLLDARLVLAVRLLLGAVGAPRLLPLDVRPDATQLLLGSKGQCGWQGRHQDQ